MRNIHLVAILIIVLFSCENTSPDPDSIHDPDPSKFYANQTVLDSICAISIAFDNDGTAWIGTLSQGLVKYGLSQTKVFNSSNSPITDHAIWDIAVDSKNNIWIGTNGLIKYDGQEFTNYNTTNSEIPEDIVWSVAVDSNDDIWVASSRHKKGGIAKFNGENFVVYTPENSPLPVNSAHAIAIDNYDNVWVAATQTVFETYLIKIANESWNVYNSLDFDIEICWVRDMEINIKNQLCGAIDYTLSGTEENPPLIFCFDGNKMDTFTADSIRGGFQSLLVDNEGGFWGTFGHGYAYFDGDQWSRFISEIKDVDGVSTYQTGFFTSEQAPDGNIWIGKGNGIEILEKY